MLDGRQETGSVSLVRVPRTFLRRGPVLLQQSVLVLQPCVPSVDEKRVILSWSFISPAFSAFGLSETTGHRVDQVWLSDDSDRKDRFSIRRVQQRNERLDDEVAPEARRSDLHPVPRVCLLRHLLNQKIWLPGAARFLQTFLCCVVAVPETGRISRFRPERVHFIPYQRVLDLHGHFRWSCQGHSSRARRCCVVGERQLCCSSTSASSCACRSVLLVLLEIDPESPAVQLFRQVCSEVNGSGGEYEAHPATSPAVHSIADGCQNGEDSSKDAASGASSLRRSLGPLTSHLRVTSLHLRVSVKTQEDTDKDDAMTTPLIVCGTACLCFFFLNFFLPFIFLLFLIPFLLFLPFYFFTS